MFKFLMIVMMMCVFVCGGAFAQEEMDMQTPVDFDVKIEGVEYGKMEYKTYYSTACQKERNCFVYLPAGYDPEQAYPLLFLLHGIGGNASEWNGGKPGVVVGNLVNKGEAKDMIIVTPDIKALKLSDGNPGMYTPEAFAAFDYFIHDLQEDLLPFLKENYKLKEGRENMAVAGLSMGGREALYIGLSMPETFGYIGAFCPAPGVLPYFAEKGLFETAAFKVQEGYEDTYILINAGKSDNVVGEWPVTYANTLKQNGTACVFYEMPGGHDFNVWKNGLYHFAKAIFQD